MPAMDLCAPEVDRLLAIASGRKTMPKLGELIIGKAVPMCSAAGWYVGRPCVECGKIGKNKIDAEWWPIPYNRETSYLPTKKHAIALLINIYETDEIGLYNDD